MFCFFLFFNTRNLNIGEVLELKIYIGSVVGDTIIYNFGYDCIEVENIIIDTGQCIARETHNNVITNVRLTPVVRYIVEVDII